MKTTPFNLSQDVYVLLTNYGLNIVFTYHERRGFRLTEGEIIERHHIVNGVAQFQFFEFMEIFHGRLVTDASNQFFRCNQIYLKRPVALQSSEHLIRFISFRQFDWPERVQKAVVGLQLRATYHRQAELYHIKNTSFRRALKKHNRSAYNWFLTAKGVFHLPPSGWFDVEAHWCLPLITSK